MTRLVCLMTTFVTQYLRIMTRSVHPFPYHVIHVGSCVHVVCDVGRQHATGPHPVKWIMIIPVLERCLGRL